MKQETLIDKKFISSLLPAGYEEHVFDSGNIWSCRCKKLGGGYMDGKDGDDGTWERFCEKLEEEFGDNLIEIYSNTSQGADFTVYLRKKPVKENCTHDNFKANVKTIKIADDNDTTKITGYRCEVSIFCVDCGEAFNFVGLPAGYDVNHPTISIDGLELRVPIAPSGENVKVRQQFLREIENHKNESCQK